MPGSPDRSKALGPVGIESRKRWRIASSDSRPITSPAKGSPASVPPSVDAQDSTDGRVTRGTREAVCSVIVERRDAAGRAARGPAGHPPVLQLAAAGRTTLL